MSNQPDLFDEFGVGADNTDRQRPATGAMSPAVTYQPVAQREAGADLFDEFDVQPESDYGYGDALKRGVQGAAAFASDMVRSGAEVHGRTTAPLREGGARLVERFAGDNRYSDALRADPLNQGVIDLADNATRHWLERREETGTDPELGQLVQDVTDRADSDGYLSAIGELASGIRDNPHIAGRTLTEQVPSLVAGGGGGGTVARQTAQNVGPRLATYLTGAGVGAGQGVVGGYAPNLERGLDMNDGDWDAARRDAAVRTGAESAVLGAGTGFAGLQVGRNMLHNAIAQPIIQGGTEMASLEAGARAVGDEVSAGERLLAGGLGAVMSPVDVVLTRYLSGTGADAATLARLRGEAEEGGAPHLTPQEREDLVGRALREGDEDVRAIIERETGVRADDPQSPDLLAALREQRQQDLSTALTEDAPVFRRDQVQPDPETGDLSVPPDARPMEVPGRGQQATAADIEARRRVRSAIEETGARLSEREIDLAARDVLAAQGDDPAAVARQTVRDYDQRSREGAFRESEYRRYQAHGDGPEGTPQGRRPQGRDYQPGGRPYDTREGVMLLEGARRDRQGRLVAGRPVEAVPDPQTGTQIRRLREDGPSEMHVRDPATGETRWVRTDQIEEHQRPDAPRQEQDFRERATTRPAGIGTELRDPTTATDRIQTADQAQRVPDPPRSFVEPGQPVDGEVQRQLGAPPRSRGPGAAEEPPAPPRIDGPEGPQAPPQGGPRRPAGRPPEDGPGQPGAVPEDAPRTRNVQTPRQTRQLEQQRRLEGERARAEQSEQQARVEQQDAPEHGSVTDAEAAAGARPQPRPPRRASGQKVNTETDNILQAVAKMGGLNRNELVAEGLDPASLTGRSGDVGLGVSRRWWKGPRARQPGDSLDGMRERLVEQGYLRDGATTDDLIRAVERQMAGDDQMSMYGGYDTLGARMADEAADEYTGGRQYDTDFTEPEAAGAARAQQTDDARRPARKKEKLDWFVNYTNDPSSGRTAEVRRFDTLREAREFARGKSGYITRQSDGGRDFDPDASSTQFSEYFGDFQPSAQEGRHIEGLTGEPAPDAAPTPRPRRAQQAADDDDIPMPGEGAGRTDDPFDLEQPTPDSVRAREEAAERAEAEARTSREAEEARMRADSEVDEFELTGSDRPADQGGGRQADLVSEARTAEMRQKRNEQNADGDGVPARERETLESVEENIASGSQFYSGIPLDRLSAAVGRALKRAFNGGDERAWSSYAAGLRRLVDSFREGRERRAAAREDGAASIGAGSRVSNTVQATIGDANAQLRVIGDRYDSPTIRNLADTMRARAGEAKGVGRSFSERSRTEINKAGSRLKDLSDEIAAARLTSRANQRAIIEMVENKRPRRGKAGEIANKIETLYADMLEYQRKAGVPVNRADHYFSRHLDMRKISGSRKNERRFTRQASKAYQEIGYTREQADMAANALMEKLVMGEPQSAPGQTTIFTHGVPEKNLNPRRFSEAAAKHLSDFRDTDIDRVLSSYTMQAIRRSEIARTTVRTGDGQEFAFGHAWENWPEIERAMRNEGATAEDVGAARNLVATMTGTRNYGASRATMNVSTALRNWAAMALLDQVALSTAPEFFTPALRASSGNAAADMGRVMNMGRVHMQTAIRKAFNTITGSNVRDRRLEEAYALNEDLGIIAGDAVSYIMQARFLGDDLSGRGQQKILTSYFKNVGLTQLNDYHRAISTRTAHTFMRRMGKDTLAGGRKENQGAYMLRELGVPKGRERAFSEWMQRTGFDEQMPTGTQLAQIKQRGGEGREFARALETAFIRFADQSIMAPDATTRPAWASTPLGAVAFSLLNFTWAFHENVLSRWWRMGTQRGEDSLDAVNRLYMMPGMVAGGMAMYGASLGFNEVRDELREGVTSPDREPAPQTDGFKAERAAAYAGFTGRADPILQIIGGVRYQRSVTETALGPAFGSIAGLTDVLAYQLEASEDTNTAERRMAQEMHHMVLSPLAQAGLALAPDFGLAGVATKAAATVGVRSTRDPFVSAVAGEEDPRVTQRRLSQPREGLVDRYIMGGADMPGAAGPAGRQLERNLERGGGRDLERDLER